MSNVNNKPEALRLALDVLPTVLKVHPGIKAVIRAYDAEIERLRADSMAALDLVSRIRFAIGDAGYRMQDELIEWCTAMSVDADRYRKWRADYVLAGDTPAENPLPMIVALEEAYSEKAVDSIIDAAIALDAAKEARNA